VTIETDLPGTDHETSPDSTYFEPQFIGFAYMGGWDEYADELTEWGYGTDIYPPYVKVRLITESYFDYASDDPQREREYCEVRAEFDYNPEELLARGHKSDLPIELRAGYEGQLSVYGYDGLRCGDFDPAIWDNGEPFVAIDGMRFGIGFSSLSQDHADFWGSEILSQYGDYMLSSYVAINRPNETESLDFIARDWSTSLLWQWDTQTHEVYTNNDNALIGQDTSDPFLSGWITSYFVHYIDLVDLDIDRL